jgi:hypothetical protein
MANQLNVTSLDTEDLKQSLISFVQEKPEFSDIDYEGSAINTIVDLLVYNTSFTSYQANMVANESFLDTAQIRRNVVSHAQKLSYVPKSTTASRLICDIEVIPVQKTNIPTSIVMDAGTQFIASSDNVSFTFINNAAYVLSYSNVSQSYKAFNVDLYQGQRITERYTYASESINLSNTNADTATMLINVNSTPYKKATSIDEFSNIALVYFLGENQYTQPVIEFGKNILGLEPSDGDIVTITYIATEQDNANGLTNLVPASTISGYSNIVTTVTTAAYGGSEREDIDSIRFQAPKIYQAQDRALTDTDYIPILKTRFPFIRSAIAWGGETNIPPAYGTVFISILSDSGQITTSVKQQMVSFLSTKNVGSVTPTIVEPDIFHANLNIIFSYDNRRTNLSFSSLVAAIKNVVTEYNEEISDFGLFLNPSELISRIKMISGITSVDINKLVYKDVNVLNFENPLYSVNFKNEIHVGSLAIDGFSVANNSTETKVYDDKLGNVFLSYVDSSSITRVSNIGTIDYKTGEVEFALNIIDGTESLRVFVRPLQDNFYVNQNQIISIDQTDIELIQITTRGT